MCDFEHFVRFNRNISQVTQEAIERANMLDIVRNIMLLQVNCEYV